MTSRFQCRPSSLFLFFCSSLQKTPAHNHVDKFYHRFWCVDSFRERKTKLFQSCRRDNVWSLFCVGVDAKRLFFKLANGMDAPGGGELDSIDFSAVCIFLHSYFSIHSVLRRRRAKKKHL